MEAMDEESYKEKHLPHRINLLITFRERFADLEPEKREKIRDLFRCAKDISAMMVRRLLGDLGIGLGKGKNFISRGAEGLNFVDQLKLEDVTSHPLHADVLDVLKFANRAIAHHEKNDIDHSFKELDDDARLVAVIDYVETEIIKRVYGSRAEYERVMQGDNDMHRTRFDLKVKL